MTPLLIGLVLGAVLGLFAGAVITEVIADRRLDLWRQTLTAEFRAREDLDAARWRAMRTRLIGFDSGSVEPTIQGAFVYLAPGIAGADAMADAAIQIDAQRLQQEARR